MWKFKIICYLARYRMALFAVMFFLLVLLRHGFKPNQASAKTANNHHKISELHYTSGRVSLKLYNRGIKCYKINACGGFLFLKSGFEELFCFEELRLNFYNMAGRLQNLT